MGRADLRGDKGEKFAANTLMHRNNSPFSRRTLDQLQTVALEHGFHDRADLEIASFWEYAREPQGFATVPEIRWGKKARLDVPALFIYSGGKRVLRSPGNDAHPEALPARDGDSPEGRRGLPYVEENDAFFEVVRAFLAKFKLAN